MIDSYASSSLPMLIAGATGTGKELVARHIHNRSGRTGSWVPVNCAALPPNMAESLLFGHRRGAFSGAVESRRGYIRSSHQGNLFLDEVLDLPSEVQPKLLRALDFGEVHALSEDLPEYVDLRVIAAVQDNVWTRLQSGTFRQDLFQRISGIIITLPPLAARPEDILPLAQHFASAHQQVLEPGVEPVLLRYSWPGNARELRLAVERARALVPNGSLSAAAVAQAIDLGAATSRGRLQPDPNRQDGRRTELVQALVTHQWDPARTAAFLGMHRATLFRQLKTLGLSIRTLRKSH